MGDNFGPALSPRTNARKNKEVYFTKVRINTKIFIHTENVKTDFYFKYNLDIKK